MNKPVGDRIDAVTDRPDRRPERFITLDVFRGMTIFLMILVNTQGSGAIPFAPLVHASWDGCTLTDLVFPSFLFAAGTALAFVIKKEESLGNRAFLFKITRRALLLFLIGFLLAWYPFRQSFGDTRILSVLQRIALAYFLAALAARFLSPKMVLGLAAILLIGYWGLLYFFGDKGMPYSVAGNFVRKIDLSVLGERHMYREGPLAFDPEGLLSTIPSVVNVLAGWMAGRLIIRKGKSIGLFTQLIIVGNILLVGGVFWSYWLPLNKKLWTSSYVLYATGIDLVVLGLLFYFVEWRSNGSRSWRGGVAFFSVFGRNPLFIYIFSNIMGIFLVMRIKGDNIFIDWIGAVFFQKITPGPMGDLLFALCYTLLCWVVGWVLDKRKIYIRL